MQWNACAGTEHLAAQSWADVGQSPLDPFSLVADEISSVSERLRRTIMSDIPVLSKAAEYFFQASCRSVVASIECSGQSSCRYNGC